MKQVKNLELNEKYYNEKDFISCSGLDQSILDKLQNKSVQELSELDSKRYEEFENSIRDMVPVGGFLKNVLSRLETIKLYGKGKWTGKEFTGTLKGEDYYKVKIIVDTNKVYYSSMTAETFLRGTLRKIHDKYVVTYSDTVCESVKEDGKIHTDTTTKTSTQYFSEKEKLSVHSSSFEQDSYDIAKESTSKMENKKHFLQDYGVVLKKKNILDKEEFFIGRKEDATDLLSPVSFQKVEKEVYEKQLKQGK
ncbi:MAG: hypothetical protein IJ193_07700 [Bacilli bacterium]|nr:hypothetical protein [Bacilli bacterium]